MSTSKFTVELCWKCEHVLTEAIALSSGKCSHLNLGRRTNCEKCGHEKTVDCRDDYLPDGTKIESNSFSLTDVQISKNTVSDAQVKELFDRGQTWICTICTPETDNRSTGDLTADICSRCGSPRLSTGMDRGKAERVMVNPDFDVARAHQHDVDVSDGPPPVDPFTGRVEGNHRVAATRKLIEETEIDGDLSSWTMRFWVAAALFMAVGVILGLWWLLASHPVHVHVAAVKWSRSARLEQRTTLDGRGWGASPAGAFNASCSLRDTGHTRDCHPYDCQPHPKQFLIGSHQCHPHPVKKQTGRAPCGSHNEKYSCGTYECNCTNRCIKAKNGSADCTRSCSTCSKTCTRSVTDYCPTYADVTEYDNCPEYETRTVYNKCYEQCPILNDYCTYQYYQWNHVNSRTLDGDDLHPKWPDLIARDETQRLHQSGSYRVIFSNGVERYDQAVEENDFSKYAVDSKWVIDVNRAGLVSNARTETP